MSRKLGELVNQELEREKSKNESLLATVQTQLAEIADIIVERDQFRQETKLLQNNQHDNRARSVFIEAKFKNQNEILLKQLQLAQEENKSQWEKTKSLEKKLKEFETESKKLKLQIIRLKLRKGRSENMSKICKNCSKEYAEKENFNWSCRTHQSDWGGEVWWCCGKRGIDQPGCKFGKHKSKEEEGDSDDSQNRA